MFTFFILCLSKNTDEKITEEVFTYETCAGITHDVVKVSYKVHYTGNFNDEFPYEETKCAQLVMNYSFMKSVMDLIQICDISHYLSDTSFVISAINVLTSLNSRYTEAKRT